MTIYKKLMYRSLHRGCKETDIIIGNFAQDYLATFNEEELAEFERILEQPDNDIFDWLTGKTKVPAEMEGTVMTKLLNYDIPKSLNDL